MNESIRDKMREAAVARDAERIAAFHEVADIVLGPTQTRISQSRVTDVAALGDGFIVRVARSGSDVDASYTTVYEHEASNIYFPTWQEAVLHLIARSTGHARHDFAVVGFAWRLLNPLEDRV